MKISATLVCLSLFCLSALAQTPNLFDFDATNDVKLTVGTDSLQYAWAGGLNNAQVNTIDLDLDGIQDLVIADNSGKHLMTYLTKGAAGQQYYEYAPEFEAKFPVIGTWMLIKDYNCDGKKDIFFNKANSILVWENTSTSELSFTPANGGNFLGTVLPGGPTLLFNNEGNMPAISDIDDDGDLDIFVFTNSGVTVEFHENLTNCGLNFSVSSLCWGYFLESGLYRSALLKECPPFKKKVQHSGSSMLLLDLDADDVQDLLLGNVSFSDITALYNGGTKDSTVFISQDTLYPTTGQSIDVHKFPATFYEDVNFDGQKDLLASPFLPNGENINRKSLHLYKDVSATATPDFQYEQSDFVQGKMMDLGEGAVPRLVDLDGDSLLDLVVANSSAFIQSDSQYHFYWYLKNTGTSSRPEFTLLDSNFLNISQYGLGKGTIPAFGDLDGDGDLDMLIGDANGMIHYFKNSSATTPSFTLETAGIIAGTVAIDVGNNAAPFLYDMDDDGDLDLLVGNELGTIYYYKNNTTNAPNFTLFSPSFGGVDVKAQTGSFGLSIPYVFEANGKANLFVGSSSNGLFQYDSVANVATLPTQIEATVGSGTLESQDFEETPFGTEKKNGRNQFLIRASELKQAGLEYGFIKSLAFYVTSSNNATMFNGITVQLKNVADTILTDFLTGLENVRSYGTTTQSFPNQPGWAFVNLRESFLWDGESNLAVEICYGRGQNNNNVHVQMTDVGWPSHALGSLQNNQTMTNGCNQPLKTVINKRPNVRISLTPSFLNSENYYHVNRSAPAVADLDGDGFVDMLLGNNGGGLQYFKGKKYVGVGLPEIEARREANFAVFPNPGDGRFHIHIENYRGQAELRVFDLTGKMILEKQISQREAEVNLDGQPAGLYIFTLMDSEGISNRKVMLR